MRSEDLRLVVGSLACALTLATPSAVAQDAKEPKPENTAAGQNNGLPSNLVLVPGGEVKMGSELEELWELCKSTLIAPSGQIASFELSASELGETKAKVDDVYMGRALVTNGEYLKFVKATGHRFPYHWWRYGEQEDYNERIREINQLYPDQGPAAPLDYWEFNWQKKNLPYSLKDQNGADITDQPVRFVSQRDALAYAAWVGMRLPYEHEWTRAARGDTEANYVWGATGKGEDQFVLEGGKTLRDLEIYGTDAKLRPAGKAGPMTEGPYGHLDMVGQLWEWTLTRAGYMAGREKFEREWKDLRKVKELREATIENPAIMDSDYVTKGGSYGAAGKPVALHIDVRAFYDAAQYFEVLGFRVAKSPVAGRDLAFSSIESGYMRDLLKGNQDLLVDQQVGMERYILDDKGRIERYDGIAFVPANFFMVSEKKSRLDDFEEMSIEAGTPPLLGTLIATTALAEPALDKGIYSVCYRAKGFSDELEEALSLAGKEIKSGKEAKNGDGPSWRSVFKKYGLTEEDAKTIGASKIDFVRIGGPEGLKVACTKYPHLVLRDNEGNWVAAIELRKNGELKKDTRYDGPSLSIDTTGPAHKVEVTFGAPLTAGDKAHVLTFPFTIAAPGTGGDVPWRTTNEAAGEGRSGSE